MTKAHALRTVKAVKELKEDKGKKFKSFQQYIVDCIMWDLSDRGRLKHIFREIYEEDRQTYHDIKKTWEYIIEECCNQFDKDLIEEN